ncbi:MAG TPA: hypothetical protein GXZ98_01865 [Firmicutes bacterium]|nr:hypothetical protein [Bacillota bacterium]
MVANESWISQIETQKSSNSMGRIEKEAGRLVSIIISNKILDERVTVERSERTAIYDGFIKYEPGWLLIIENKPNYENIWLEQLNPNISENITIEEKCIALCWPDIIENFSSLLERDLVYGSDRKLLEDFLDYSYSLFAWLNPYTKFGVYKDNEYLLNERCKEIMRQLGMGEVGYHRGWHHYIQLNYGSVKQISLFPSIESPPNWEIHLTLHPGDTMTQARELYRKLDIERLLELAEKGWKIQTNFHFSFATKNLMHTKGRIKTEEYLRYWQRNVDSLRQIKRDEFRDFFERMLEMGIVLADDFSVFKADVLDTNRNFVNVCPGIYMEFKWDKEQAIKTDARDQFVEEVRDKIEDALQALGIKN